MPERDAVLCELILKMLAVDAGLDPRRERESVDLKHAVHAAHVEADNHPAGSVLWLKAADDVGAATKRDKHHAVLVGSNRRAVAAAADRARALGYADPLVLTTTLEGEAREVAKVLAAASRSLARNTPDCNESAAFAQLRPGFLTVAERFD